jgi:uncharacterized protein YndB with AHSA1/START domain
VVRHVLVTSVMNRIDVRAPVVGAAEIEISAEPELVWGVLTAFERWPTWNPHVESLSMRGDVSVGSEFRWKAGPGTITSTIQEVDPPRRIAWTGRTLGIRAVHVWWLEPSGSVTTVLTEESYQGLVARLFRRSLQKTLDRALDDGLRYLKAEVERRAVRSMDSSGAS